MMEAYLITIFLSLLLATAELFTKFKDEPLKVVMRYHAWLYILLNVGIAVLTLYILTKTDLLGTGPQFAGIKAAFIAGLGSTTLMRSKFLKININGEEAAVGPEVIINVFLETLERNIDRDRALIRKQLVEQTMADIDFTKAKDYVVQTIIGSNQTLSSETKQNLVQKADQIAGLPLGENEKSFALGYLVLDLMGEKFLNTLFNDANKARFARL